MLWLNSSRERIKSENPGISITEISKKAGEMWKQIGKDDKEVRNYLLPFKCSSCLNKTMFLIVSECCTWSSFVVASQLMLVECPPLCSMGILNTIMIILANCI